MVDYSNIMTSNEYGFFDVIYIKGGYRVFIEYFIDGYKMTMIKKDFGRGDYFIKPLQKKYIKLFLLLKQYPCGVLNLLQVLNKRRYKQCKKARKKLVKYMLS